MCIIKFSSLGIFKSSHIYVYGSGDIISTCSIFSPTFIINTTIVEATPRKHKCTYITRSNRFALLTKYPIPHPILLNYKIYRKNTPPLLYKQHHHEFLQVGGFAKNKIRSSNINLRTNLAQSALPFLGVIVPGNVAYNSKSLPFNPINNSVPSNAYDTPCTFGGLSIKHWAGQ
mmetsp:Transcript_24422/g.32541  ORF Transcript_24422/g.32541 Transcript_24422/m.32541 type:complete len:173 (-) Transcript_24422:1819-2337(-)